MRKTTSLNPTSWLPICTNSNSRCFWLIHTERVTGFRNSLQGVQKPLPTSWRSYPFPGHEPAEKWGSRSFFMSSKHREFRSHTMIDQPVQGALIGRVVSNWTSCLIAFSGIFFLWSVFLDGQVSRSTWEHFQTRIIPCLLASYILVPIAIVDQLKLSCRFVGPVHEIKSTLRRTMLGDEIKPLELRRSDFWHDLASQVNEFIETSPERTIEEEELPLPKDFRAKRELLGLPISPLQSAARHRIASSNSLPMTQLPECHDIQATPHA